MWVLCLYFRCSTRTSEVRILFIGDGMGLNQVNGTALATGVKTYNGAIGMNDQKQTIQSVAEKAKRAGKKVEIATSVSIDHATPAAFYAHQPNRDMYYEIATDLPKANFDFYAGTGFLSPTTTFSKEEAPSIYPLFEEAGYMLARGYTDYKAKASTARKMILMQEEKGTDPSSLPYAIDRKATDLTLTQITESAIGFLCKGNKAGFFLMVEGGKIDWACHANDAATVFNEVINQIAQVGWKHNSHTAGYVPVFVIGAGSQLFGSKMDNIQIPQRIAKVAKY